jgi:catechol 2,3-dioxygenase-like lactoylglutathione lyase family enzyme
MGVDLRAALAGGEARPVVDDERLGFRAHGQPAIGAALRLLVDQLAGHEGDRPARLGRVTGGEQAAGEKYGHGPERQSRAKQSRATRTTRFTHDGEPNSAGVDRRIDASLCAMEILFIAGFAPIAADPERAHAFYCDALRLPLVADSGNPDYVAMNDFGGVKHFGVWPLADAAESCFGTREWPGDMPVPQATIEFEVASVDAVDDAARELTSLGYRLVHDRRTEPWNQVIARVLGPEGLLIGLSWAPWLHERE